MKHEAIINQTFELLYEKWMSTEDRAEAKTSMFKRMGITMEQLDEEIEKGVEMGYPAEMQLEMIKKVLTSVKYEPPT